MKYGHLSTGSPAFRSDLCVIISKSKSFGKIYDEVRAKIYDLKFLSWNFCLEIYVGNYAGSVAEMFLGIYSMSGKNYG